MQLPDTIDRIRPSVVQIRASSGRKLGTGFIATDANHVVTAFHVIEAAAGEPIQVGFAGPDVDTPQVKARANFMISEGTLAGADPDHDLAVIATPSTGGLTIKLGPRLIAAPPRPARLKADTLRAGAQLAVSGYPLDEPSLITNAGILASAYSPANPPSSLQECYLGDFTANPGNSGGPVYGANDASVIGVCVGGRMAPVHGAPSPGVAGYYLAGLTVIVPAIDVLKLLADLGLQPAQPPQPRKPAAGKRRR
jgi:S1-C subfamily serine protease